MAKRKNTTAKRVQEVDATPFRLPDVTVPPEVDNDAWDDDGLTFRQREFVRALVGPAGGNATRAAEMAGYKSENVNSLRVTACQNLTKPNVQRAINRAMAEKHASPEWVKASLADVASSSMANFLKPDEKGEFILDLEKAAEAGALGQIKEYKEEVLSTGGEAKLIKRTIKIHDRLPALRTLVEMSGMLVQRHQHTVAQTPDADLLKRILSDPQFGDIGNTLARRMAVDARCDGESAN